MSLSPLRRFRCRQVKTIRLLPPIRPRGSRLCIACELPLLVLRTAPTTATLGKETALSKSAGQHSIRVFFWAAVGHDRPLRPIPSFVSNRPLTGRDARTRRRCEIGLEDRGAGAHLLRTTGCVLDLNPIKARSAVIAFTAANAAFASFRARNRRPDPGRCTFSNVWLERYPTRLNQFDGGKSIFRAGAPRSAMRGHRASAATNPQTRFAPPKAGSNCSVASPEHLCRCPTSHIAHQHAKRA